MTPPFRTPSNASYFFSGLHSATTSPFLGKLRTCNPSGLAGPQPQQALFGAYFSWSESPLMVLAECSASGGRALPSNLTCRVQTSRDTHAIRVQRKASAAGSDDYDRAVLSRARTSPLRAMPRREACLILVEIQASKTPAPRKGRH